MTDRSLLMRVLFLPHGNGSNPELDELCRDILAHCSATVPTPELTLEERGSLRDLRVQLPSANSVPWHRLGEVPAAERRVTVYPETLAVLDRLLASTGGST